VGNIYMILQQIHSGNYVPDFSRMAEVFCRRYLVLLRISKSCKRTDSGGFLKNPRIRTRIRILDESIIDMCLQTCGLVSVHQTAANGVKPYLSQATSTATN